MESKRDSTTRFGNRAPSYAAFRPGYPPEAIDAVLAGLGDPSTLTIADVGAGTGISSRLFAQRGAKVIAIEPNLRMRSQAEPDPNVEWREGTAQHTGLPDASVDLVVVAQAFHWFATIEVMLEFARVARRRAAMLQYERDERDAFTKAYGEIVRGYATDDTEALRQRALAAFAVFPESRISRTEAFSLQAMDREALLGRAASSSYLPASGAPAEALRRDLNELFDRYASGGRVALHMVTYALIADLQR
jgi:ubiquinone/menaquinone biosynthesis C-methylase UbiE